MTDVSAQQQPLDHESSYYTQIMDHPMVQQARSTYDWAKQQNSYLGSTLDSVEQRASGAVQAVHRKYSETYENYYVRPKEAVYENGKWVLENGKNAAIHTGTMALGASVLATQLALQITIGSANLVLDGAGVVVSAGKGVVTRVRQTEHAVEEKIWTAIAEAQRMAKVPVDKTAEMTHSFLDIVNALVERTLHVNIQNEPETSVKDRVKNLAQAVVSGLTARAHEQVIDPVQERTHTLLENLSKSFVLVDVVRSKKEWALEKYEELSSSVSDLKVRLENEAKQYGARPEEMLMRFIRNRSQLLKEQLQSLKSKQQEMFGNGNRLEDTISYLQGLDNQLREANDIYKVRDEVLTEARQRLAELTQWTSGLLNGQTVVEN